MTDPRETLARIRARAERATPGPWEHYSINPRITPEQAVYSVPLDADPLARGSEVAGPIEPRDAAFIAAARTNVPRLAGALQAVLNLHFERADLACNNPAHTVPDFMCPDCRVVCDDCVEDWPCPTVEAVTNALEGETND